MPVTDNPFSEYADRDSDEVASQIRGMLYAVWSRGWHKAERELTGDAPGE